MTLTELFTNIANAIRSKKGTSDKINATDFATEIENIQTGGGDISEYFTENISSGSQYGGCGLLKSIIKIPTFEIQGSSTSYMFNNCTSLTAIPKLDTSKVTSMSSMFESCTNLTTIPQLDTSNVTNMSSMFESCRALTTIPQLDTSKVTNMNSMFYSCTNLKTIPQLDTSKVANMSSMFCYCSALTEIPLLDTSKVTSMSSMFNGCTNLTTISQLDTSNVTNMAQSFYNCSKLVTIPQLDTSKVANINSAISNCTLLTDFGGFLNLGKGFTQKTNNYSNYKLMLNSSNNLTHDSLMNVINNLYDLNLTYDVANGGTLYTQQLQLGSKNLAKLTAEEIAIATNKRMVC